MQQIRLHRNSFCLKRNVFFFSTSAIQFEGPQFRKFAGSGATRPRAHKVHNVYTKSINFTGHPISNYVTRWSVSVKKRPRQAEKNKNRASLASQLWQAPVNVNFHLTRLLHHQLRDGMSMSIRTPSANRWLHNVPGRGLLFTTRYSSDQTERSGKCFLMSSK